MYIKIRAEFSVSISTILTPEKLHLMIEQYEFKLCKFTYTWIFPIIYTTGPQPFWHQGPVLWKAVFSRAVVGRAWLQDDSHKENAA